MDCRPSNVPQAVVREVLQEEGLGRAKALTQSEFRQVFCRCVCVCVRARARLGGWVGERE